MKKLRLAVLGAKGKNLDDLKQMDGKEFLGLVNSLYFLFFVEFVHTSDIESLNSLILKYCSKKDSYRLVFKTWNKLF